MAIRNTAAGKSAFGINPFGKKATRERYQRLRLNGKAPQKSEDWQWIESHLCLRREMRTFIYRWNSLVSECPAPQLPDPPFDALRCTEALLAQMKDVRRWVYDVAPCIGGEVEAIFGDINADGIANDPAKMDALADAIEIRLKRHRLEAAREERKKLRTMFAAQQLPIFTQGVAFFDHFLGNRGNDSLAIEKGWQSIVAELERVHAIQPSLETIHNVSITIAKGGALKWASQLRSEPEAEGSADWTPDNWALAWKWSRQFGYLEAIDGRKHVQALASMRLNLQNDLAAAYAHLVEKLTWLKLRETLDQDRGLMSALQQYMAAIRGIGAGTGVRAVRFRQDARRAMAKAPE